MGKGEIDRYEQFLLFPQCFQKACFTGTSKGVTVLEWVKQCAIIPKARCLPFFFMFDNHQVNPSIEILTDLEQRQRPFLLPYIFSG